VGFPVEKVIEIPVFDEHNGPCHLDALPSLIDRLFCSILDFYRIYFFLVKSNSCLPGITCLLDFDAQFF